MIRTHLFSFRFILSLSDRGSKTYGHINHREGFCGPKPQEVLCDYGSIFPGPTKQCRFRAVLFWDVAMSGKNLNYAVWSFYVFPGVSVFKVVVGTSQCPLKQGWLLFETPLLFKFGFSGFWIRKNKIKRNEQLNHQQHTNLYKPQCHQRVLPLLQLIKPILLFLFILCPSIL